MHLENREEERESKGGSREKDDEQKNSVSYSEKSLDFGCGSLDVSIRIVNNLINLPIKRKKG